MPCGFLGCVVIILDTRIANTLLAVPLLARLFLEVKILVLIDYFGILWYNGGITMA